MRDDILLDQRDRVVTITFNRPQHRNAITYDMWQALADILRRLDNDPSVHVVVFQGAGDRAFSAGADISEFETHRSDSTRAKRYSQAVHDVLEAIPALSKPTLSLIKGFCVGGGCELAVTTDLRIAADNSHFGLPIAKLGILVGYQEMRRLVHLVGPGAAMDLLLSARLIDAQEALRIGLISRLVPLAQIEDYTFQLARDIASYAPLSHRWHKQILQTVLQNPALEGLSQEEEHLPFACFDTEDFREGRRAFLEKRTPHFQGR